MKKTVIAVFCLVGSAYAHDGSTPYAQWMMSLKQPHHPLVPCCGPADQFYVREYVPSAKEGMEFTATVIGRPGLPDFEIDIPRNVVIWDRANPTGRGVVFIMANEFEHAVLCFVPGVGT